MVPSPDDTPTDDPPAKAGADLRRTFLVQAAAIVIGGIVGFVPLLIGLRNFLNPLLRSKDDIEVDEAVRIATLDDLGEIGKVYRFKVNAIRVDAWSKHPPGPIGAVYVRRDSDDPQVLPKVYTSVCPHLGCSVDYKEDRQQFACPCHGSMWSEDGKRIDPATAVTPRDLDELEDVEIRNGNELWVVYRRFRSGIAAKIAE